MDLRVYYPTGIALNRPIPANIKTSKLKKAVTAMTLEELLEQENELIFPHFNSNDAWQLGVLIRELAIAADAQISIDISIFDQLLFAHAMTGTSLENSHWIRRKKNAVKRFGHSSYYLGELYRAQGASFESKTQLDPNEYAAHGGCFPLLIAGTGMVGSVTISGLAQFEDHLLVTQALGLYLKQQASR